MWNVRAVHCSYNADMLPDLLAENASGSWTIYLASVKHGFVAMEPLLRRPLAMPHSSAFVDLREDYAAGAICTYDSCPMPNCFKYNHCAGL